MDPPSNVDLFSIMQMARSVFDCVPLHRCAAFGRLRATPALLSPETVQASDNQGHLPLHCAARTGQYPIVKVLLSCWPEGTAVKNNSGYLPLHYAVETNLDTVRALLALFPDGARSMESRQGKIPLQLAARRDDVPGDRMGWTALHDAADFSSLNVLKLLLRVWPEGAAARTKVDQTPRDVAVMLGRRGAVAVFDALDGHRGCSCA